MVLQWTRIDPEGPGLHLPKLPGDVGWDLEAAEDALLGYNEQRDISTNVRVKLPPGAFGEIRARSSIARRGLQVDSGLIDCGYTGPLLVLMRNMNSGKLQRDSNCDQFGRVQIRQGERIAQLVLHRAVMVEGQEVEELEHDPRRGMAGFGSTGV